MIQIVIEPAQFEYDVQSLVQAFYPGHPFKVHQDVSNFFRRLKIQFTENKIIAELSDQEKILGKEECVWDCSRLDGEFRRKTKNVLKQIVYKLLSADTHQTLSWGTLTGIRPVKIPALMLREGKSEDEISRVLRETYFLSGEKQNLVMEIAKRQEEILREIPYENGYSLYIGIPFCPTTCLYCSFTSYPMKRYENQFEAYLCAVFRELEVLSKQLQGKILTSVYIGGGTPTTLHADQLKRLILKIKEQFDFSTVREFTVEAGRPDSITKEKLQVLKQNGVSRISINPQTMNQGTLDFIGRRHSVEQVREAFRMARACGMDNINMDFIVGLPGEDENMVRHSMEEAKALKPDSLTIHSMAVKRASRLRMNQSGYDDLQFQNDEALMNLTASYAEEMGMKPYYLYRQKNMAGNQENVGYAKPGYEGLYNILMMGDKQTIVAFGAGSVSKKVHSDESTVRCENVKDIDQYIERIEEMIGRKQILFTGS